MSIGSTFIEQSFAVILILCAVVFDIILIITFIISLFYDLGSFDIIGEIINVTLAPLTFTIILAMMGASKYAFNKAGDMMAVDEDESPQADGQEVPQVNTDNKDQETVGDEKNESVKKTEDPYQISDEKVNNQAAAINKPINKTDRDNKRLPELVIEKEPSPTDKAKATGKQAAMVAAQGGLEAGKELAKGEVKAAATTTVKTGIKISTMFAWMGLGLLLKAIPYSEVIPWYTIWAVFVWFKITYGEIKNISI